MPGTAPTQHEPELSGARITGQSGHEPGLGGDRSLDWSDWRALLDERESTRKRLERIPEQDRERYLHALLEVLPQDATYTRTMRNGDLWRGRYTDAQRLSAINLLGALRDQRAVGPLARQLEVPPNHMRVAIVMALAWIGGPAAMRVLTQALHHPSEDTRVAAASCLGWVGSESARQPLARALKDPAERVRVAAATSLAWMGDSRAFGPLMETFWQREEAERNHILEELRRYDLRRTISSLIQAHGDKGSPRYQAATEALRRLATPEALTALEGYDHRSRGDFSDF